MITGTNLLAEAGQAPGGFGAAAAEDVGQKAVRVMGAMADVYGVADASREFAVRAVHQSATGYRHVRLRQVYRGLQVVGAEVVVHFDSEGAARAVNGVYRSVGSLDVVAEITPEQAVESAQADQAAMGKMPGRVSEDPELVIYARDIDPALAYQLTISYDDGRGDVGRWQYWIDARRGAVICAYNDIQTAVAPPTGGGTATGISGSVLAGEGGGVASVSGWSQNGLFYLWNQPNKWHVFNWGGGVHSGDSDADDYAWRAVTNWGTSDRAEMSTAVGFEAILDYYLTVHGRNSFDGMGRMAKAKVHYGTDYVNAFYNGDDFTFGDGDGSDANELCVLDVATHEFQHGVTEYSADLVYAYEPGALNESFSDIFGTLVEFRHQPDGRASYPNANPGTADWLMGEDCWLSSTALRDMRSPANTATVGAGNEQPTRYKGTHWYFGTGDNGGVHYNSSVQNFFFYLLCEGGSGTNDGAIVYAVPGVGIPVGEKLAYLTLTSYMTPNTDYAAARDAWIAAAQQLDGAGSTTNTVISVMLAWGAVGVGSVEMVTPATPFTSGGEPAVLPYVPSNQVYTVLNPTANPVTWTISSGGSPWLQIDPSILVLAGQSFGSVTVSVDQAVAVTLAEGTYTETVSFTNDAGLPNATRQAILRIGGNYTVRSAAYNWIDPVANLHQTVSMPSGLSAAKPIPFPFSLYGVAHSNLYITPYGMVGFSPAGLATNENSDLPDGGLPNSILCPLWDALTGHRLPGRVYYYADPVSQATNRRVVVTWLDVGHELDANARFSFQIVLTEGEMAEFDDDILFQYKEVAESRPDVGCGRSATIGIEDDVGAMFRKYSFNGEKWLADRTALVFTQMPQPDLTPPTGTIRALGGIGSTVTFGIAFDEAVEGLELADIVLVSSVSGASLGALTGGGMRYEVAVENVNSVGALTMSVVGGAVLDLADNPNAAFGPALYVVPLETVNFEDNMDQGPALWTTSYQVFELFTGKAWEWGVPTYAAGPASAYSGSNCWGTILTNDYPNGMDAWLMSPLIQVGAYPVLDFYVWHDLESFVSEPVDVGYVEVDNGSGWTVVESYGGWPVDWQPRHIVLDNDVYGNRFIRVRFRATSNYTVTRPGLYVDDFRVTSQRSPGVWVLDYSPTNGVPGATGQVTFVAYNASTTTYAEITGTVGSSDHGVGVSNPVVFYGAMGPGSVVTAPAPVAVVLGMADEFQKPVVQLWHQAKAGNDEVSLEFVPFFVDGIIAAPASNRLVVKSSTGVTNWLGRFLHGDGGATSCLFQAIYAGTNDVADPAADNGQATGDDRVLYSAGGTTDPRGRFGVGGVAADYGQFVKSFEHNLGAGAKVYVRAWDAATFSSSAAYGDSGLYALTSGVVQTNDFMSWVVRTPVNAYNDSNGDSIPDGYCVDHGMDPRLPIAPLIPGWRYAASPMGSKGTGPGQFNSVTPSPTRLFYKGPFLYALDTGNNRVQVWNRLTQQYLASYGTQGTNNGMFKRPYGIAVDPRAGTNRFAVADQGNYRIQVFHFDPATGTNIAFAFAFGSYGSGSSGFQKPTDVAIGPDGRIYVADEQMTDGGADASCIKVFSSEGVYEATPVSASSVTRPWGIDVGADGQLVVADTSNNRIQAWDEAGALMWPLSGTNTAVTLLPRGVRMGSGGRVYAADTGMSRIHVLRSDGSLIGTLGSQGDVVGQTMNHPYGVIQVLESNVVYVADTYNGRVLTVTPTYDGDEDGMDDLWEELFGLNPEYAGDAMMDFDEDGFLNIGEYRLQQNPGAPPLRIDIPDAAAGVLEWYVPFGGDVYIVEYTYDLTLGTWTPATVITSTVAGMSTWSITTPMTNSGTFFRIRRVP